MQINHLVVTPETQEEANFLKSLGVPNAAVGDNYKVHETEFAQILHRGFPLSGFTREVFTG